MATCLLVVLVLMSGAGITTFLAALRYRDGQAEFEARYQMAEAHVLRNLHTGIERYATVLRGAAGYLSASPNVDPDEFTSYGRSLALEENYPGIRRVGFIRHVPWDDRDAFMANLVARVPDAITEVPGPPHDLAIVTLMTGGLRGIGRDLGADPVRSNALARARDFGTVQMTDPVSLVIDPRTPRDLTPDSVALYAPVYDTPQVPATVAERRARLIGWTTTAFNLADIPNALDLGADLIEVHLRSHASPMLASEDAPDARVEHVRMFGQAMHVVLRPDPAFGSPTHDWIAVLWVGATTTCALAVVLGLHGTHRVRLRREVAAAVATSEEANRRLEAEASFRNALLGNLQVGVIATDLGGNVEVYNLDSEGFHDGPEPNEFRGAWSDVLALHTQLGGLVPEQCNPMTRALRGDRVRGEEYLVRPCVGIERSVLCNAQPITDPSGAVLGAVVAIHDVTPLKAAQERLADLARSDPLTGLPNRVALMERTHAALIRSGQTGGSVGLLFLDLDGFKAVNDEHGHDVGDELLRVAAARLRAAVRTSDTPARLGGDEFVVLCDRDVDGDALALLAQRVAAALAKPYPLSGATVHIDVSVGTALAVHGDDPARLLRRADQAMYQAKLGRRAATTAECQTCVDR